VVWGKHDLGRSSRAYVCKEKPDRKNTDEISTDPSSSEFELIELISYQVVERGTSTQ